MGIKLSWENKEEEKSTYKDAIRALILAVNIRFDWRMLGFNFIRIIQDGISDEEELLTVDHSNGVCNSIRVDVHVKIPLLCSIQNVKVHQSQGITGLTSPACASYTTYKIGVVQLEGILL